jgi:KUP system potassium uptake protein
VQAPPILMALNPWFAVQFFVIDQWLAFLALGSVVLAVTGSEALYSDMGHFGQRLAEVTLPLDIFARSGRNSTAKVPGTALFMASDPGGTPSALLHNIKHNKVLHERVIVLTVHVAEIPYVEEADRFSITEVGSGFYRVVLHYGFMEETDIPAALAGLNEICAGPIEMMQTSFFLSRQTLLSAEKPGMAVWREKLFSWMLRNAATPMESFRLPTNRVVELGSQLEI